MYPPIDAKYYAEDPYRVEQIARLGVAITYTVRQAPCDDLMIYFLDLLITAHHEGGVRKYA